MAGKSEHITILTRLWKNPKKLQKNLTTRRGRVILRVMNEGHASFSPSNRPTKRGIQMQFNFNARQQHAFAAIAVSLAMVTPMSPARGDIIRFDNPAEPIHFDWNASPGHQVLNVLMSASGQGRGPGMGTISRADEFSKGSIIAFTNPDGEANLMSTNLDGIDYVAGLVVDTLIGPAVAESDWSGNLYYTDLPGLPQSAIPENTSVYLGFRFRAQAGDLWTYAWVGVTRLGSELDAFAWGYESEAGVPIAAGASPPQLCMPDIDGNATVDVDDLIAVILNWGSCGKPPAPCPADIDENGAVDVDDLIAVILGWGPCR